MKEVEHMSKDQEFPRWAHQQIGHNEGKALIS